MKNKKLLIPIISIAGLCATIAPIAAMTSCSCNPDADPVAGITIKTKKVNDSEKPSWLEYDTEPTKPITHKVKANQEITFIIENIVSTGDYGAGVLKIRNVGEDTSTWIDVKDITIKSLKHGADKASATEKTNCKKEEEYKAININVVDGQEKDYKSGYLEITVTINHDANIYPKISTVAD